MSAQLFCAIFESNVSDNEVTEGNMKVGELEAEKNTKLKELAAEFAMQVPENEFSPAQVKLYLMGYRKSPSMAVKNVQEWVVRLREEKRPNGADLSISEGFRKGNDGTPPDNSTTPAASLDGAQDQGMRGAIAQVEFPIPATDSHCCSCQVLDDIMENCRAEEMPSIEQSLLFNHLCDLEAYRGSHTDRVHSTVRFLNLLLDFVKKTYTCSTEFHSTLPAAFLNSPSLQLPPRDDLLTLSHPATKIVEHLESKLEEAHPSEGDTTTSHLRKCWDEAGWEPLVLDFNHETPDLLYNLHPLDYAYSDASKTSPDDSSSGTSFESGSDMSSDDENIVAQAEATEESAGLKTNCSFYRQPAAPPATPNMTSALLGGNQGKEMAGSAADLRPALENVSRNACLADG